MAVERAVVYGAGALGSYLGARLAAGGGLPVTLVARRAHAEAIRARGLAVGGREEFLVPPGKLEVRAEPAAPGRGALVLVTVKLPDLAAAGRALAALARPDALFLLVQNGLAGRELFLAGAGRELAATRAIASCGVDLVAPGRVEYWGGGLALERSARSAELAALFARAGVECSQSPDFPRALWKKLAVNCVANPLTALTGARNREIVTPELAALRSSVVEEVRRLAAAEGRSLPADLAARIDEALAASGNRSSMVQDLERGRPTEIEYLNGFVAARSAELGLEAPANAALAALIRARVRVGAARR